MTLPNFLVIGAGRSGTTSLQRYLAQHPQVYLPATKAPSHYYCLVEDADRHRARRHETRHHFVRDPAAYEALFDAWSGEPAVGEVSPAYLCAPAVADRIAEAMPDVRLVAVLRDPIERVHARYVARRRDGLEACPSFDELIDAELAAPLSLDDTAGTYLAAGFVSHVLAAYAARFPAEQCRWYLHDELRADTAVVVRDLFGFLGVDPDASVDVATSHNRSGGEISQPFARALWTRSSALRSRVRPLVPLLVRDATFRLVARRLTPVPISPSARLRLAELYAPEVERLGTMLGRDLSHWCAAEVG